MHMQKNFNDVELGLAGPKQNYWLLRHFAAFCVLLVHSFALSNKPPHDLLRVFPALGGIAGLGVMVFFIISGYLITQSWHRHRSVAVFVWHRCLRIMPGMWGCMVFALLLGWMVSVLPTAAYWSHPQTANYVVGNLLLRNVLDLPGVFQGNPLMAGVTGTFWTLPIELTCYLGVLLLGSLGVLKSPRWSILLGIAALLAATLWGSALNLFGASILSEALPRYYAAFICGMLLYQGRVWLPLGWMLPAVLVLVASVALWYTPPSSLFWPWLDLLRVATLAWFLISAVMAFSPVWPEPEGWPDLSYGVYLYGFPIQQAVVHFYPDWNGWAVLAASGVLSVLAALISWYAIESKALRWKNALRTHR